MLEPVREEFPDRFFDVGICESHAVALGAGLAKAGLRPVVDIYSTFLQRSYDQLFQEVSLQNLPITLLLDRSGLVGPDGPTHHGMFDLTYLRPLPNLVVMAPGDASDVAPTVRWALAHDGPVAIRYAKAAAEAIARPALPVELGKAEVIGHGEDGCLIACGSMLIPCAEAAKRLAAEGVELGVINARFVKPLDTATILAAVANMPLVVTVEEGVLMGGFGSTVLEAAADAGLDTSPIHRLGIPDRFIEHGPRADLLADLGLDAAGIARSCRQWLGDRPHQSAASPVHA
jgi:1-deoxy-D-xylulose-5-phosphate synthase